MLKLSSLTKVAINPALVQHATNVGRKVVSTGAGVAAGALEHGANAVEGFQRGVKNWTDRRAVLKDPAMRTELARQSGSVVAPVVANAGLRSGLRVGALAGAAAGALNPGQDADGDDRSMIGGALRGAAGGAIMGGALGVGARHLLANPAMKRQVATMGGGTAARAALPGHIEARAAHAAPLPANPPLPEMERAAAAPVAEAPKVAAAEPTAPAKPAPPLKTAAVMTTVELPAIK
jgi:hypothetical protein